VKLVFDPTISLGNLLSLVAIVATLLRIATRLEARLTRLETLVAPLWKAYERALTKGDER
jgi:hypothetical protein